MKGNCYGPTNYIKAIRKKYKDCAINALTDYVRQVMATISMCECILSCTKINTRLLEEPCHLYNFNNLDHK